MVGDGNKLHPTSAHEDAEDRTFFCLHLALYNFIALAGAIKFCCITSRSISCKLHNLSSTNLHRFHQQVSLSTWHPGIPLVVLRLRKIVFSAKNIPVVVAVINILSLIESSLFFFQSKLFIAVSGFFIIRFKSNYITMARAARMQTS